MSVGYWVTTANGSSSIIRYTCTLNSSFNASVTKTVVISDDISATAQGSATVTPIQFAQAAGAGWAPVTASTTVAGATPIPSPGTPFSLPVTSTSGFDLSPSQPIVVTTSGGFASISCTGYQPLSGPPISGQVPAGPGASFTPCSTTAGGNTTAPAGYSVTQAASISGVNLSVFEPGSAYTYRLSAVPRAYGTFGGNGNGGGPGVGAPALLTLGGADSVQGGTQAQVTVYGNVNVNSGSLSCTGGPYLIAYGYGAISGTSAFSPTSCAKGGPTKTAPAIADPYAKVAPVYGSSQWKAETLNPAPVNGVCVPGEYTAVFTCTTLQPGVYVLDLGLGTNSISMASGYPAQGVLLYLPCHPPGAPNTCNETFTMTGNQTITLPGLSAAQSAQYFGTTALQGLVVWQEGRGTPPPMTTTCPGPGIPVSPPAQGDNCTADIRGTSGIGSTFSGTLYFPTSTVTVQGGGTGTNIAAGRVIAGSLTIEGSGRATINPG
jgi:hypothetical protein